MLSPMGGNVDAYKARRNVKILLDRCKTQLKSDIRKFTCRAQKLVIAINKKPKRTVREQFVQHIEDMPELHDDSTLIKRAAKAWRKK